MMFLCDSFWLTAKFYDQPYMHLSDGLKRHIKESITKLKSTCDMSNQDISLIETLLKLIEVLDEISNIRKNLIRLRNDLEFWRTDDNLPQHRKLFIDLTIELINLIHFGTFYCSSLNKIVHKIDQFKENLKDVKTTNLHNFNRVDSTYLGYLYKIPKLIIVKRGQLKKFRELRQAKPSKSNTNTNDEPVNDTNNDPDLN